MITFTVINIEHEAIFFLFYSILKKYVHNEIKYILSVYSRMIFKRNYWEKWRVCVSKNICIWSDKISILYTKKKKKRKMVTYLKNKTNKNKQTNKFEWKKFASMCVEVIFASEKKGRKKLGARFIFCSISPSASSASLSSLFCSLPK